MTHNNPEQKLDPFAFPPETNGRFTTLIVAAVTLMWLIGINFFGITYAALGIDFNPLSGMSEISQITDEALEGHENAQELTEAEFADLARKLQPLLVKDLIRVSFWMIPLLFLMVLMVGGAVIIYRTHPARIHRRNKLRQLPPSEDHELDEVMQALSAQAGVFPVPIIWTSKTTGVNGQAFGRRNDYILRLNRAKLLFHKYPQKFRVLVAHELGHIANRDVWRTYFSQATWFSFFILVILCLIIVVTLIILPNLEQIRLTPQMGLFLGRLLAMLLLVSAIWRGLLRSREFYADWRAASWDLGDGLEEILSQQANQKKQGIRWLRWWARIRSFHPSPTERLDVLKHPIKLFQIALDLPVLSGVILAITIFGLPAMAISLLTPILLLLEIGLSTVGPFILMFPPPLGRLLYFILIFILRVIPIALLSIGTLLCIGYLITSTLGVQVQRETIADLAHGVHRFRSYGRLWLPAVLLTIGLQLGFLVMPVGYSPPTSQWAIWLSLIWLIGFSFLTWLWLAYIRALTQLTMGSHVGSSDPKRAKLLVNAFSSVSLALLYPPVFLLLITIQFVERQLPTSVLPISNSSLSPSMFIGITIIVLLLIALSYFFGAMLSLLSLYGWLHLRLTPNCPECGDPTQHQIVVGQKCASCSSPLSPWIYVNKNKIAPSG